MLITWRVPSRLAPDRRTPGAGAWATAAERNTGHIPNATGALPRTRVHSGSRILLRVRSAGLSLRLACRSVARRCKQECGLARRLRDEWQFWNAPSNNVQLLRRLQASRCGQTGGRLWKNAEVDHRVPLFRVWRECRDVAWPTLLHYWGLPNLQVINRDIRAAEMRDPKHDTAVTVSNLSLK